MTEKQPPVMLNGTNLEPMEQRMDRLRNTYSAAMNDIMDRVLEELILPDDKATLCLDAMQYFTFLMAVKVTEARGKDLTRENLMAVYWPMQKALKDEVPAMLRTLAEQVASSHP